MQGVDVWLNNPRRPLEASGTSGQKVVLNGGLNLSVLDGWWAEAYDGLNGFAIGTGRTHSDMSIHDSRDGEDLYRVLREEVIPLYYERDRDGLPRGWIKRMKRTIRTLGWRFNANRMVMDYTTEMLRARRRRHVQRSQQEAVIVWVGHPVRLSSSGIGRQQDPANVVLMTEDRRLTTESKSVRPHTINRRQFFG